MDLRFTEEDAMFRREVREFLRTAVPADMARRTRQGVHTTKEDLKRWNRSLYDKGWSAPHWPKEYGGTGWSPLHVYLFEEECAAADAPFLSYFGLRLIGPLLYTFRTDDQPMRSSALPSRWKSPRQYFSSRLTKRALPPVPR